MLCGSHLMQAFRCATRMEFVSQTPVGANAPANPPKGPRLARGSHLMQAFVQQQTVHEDLGFNPP